MGRKKLVWLIICLVLLTCVGLTVAQPLPDYEKILVIRLDYHDGVYREADQYMRYGTPPNLNILSGNLKGVVLDTNRQVIRTFSLREPGIAVGDSPETTSRGTPSLQGYVEKSDSGEFIITLPYLQNIQAFNLYDASGASLISVDLSSSQSAFCTVYPDDPDCLCCIQQAKESVQGSKISSQLTAFLAFARALPFIAAVLLICAGSVAILWRVKSRKAAPPQKQVVLTVDDNPDIIQLLKLILGSQGYESISAPGGKECLEILKEKKKIPDVILLDIMMEPMDGWETLEKIKSEPGTKDIPVLMLTGKQLTAAEAKRYHICIEDYLMKPFTNAQLSAAIEHVLVRKKNIKENIVLAKKAGISQDRFCEFAKLSKRVDVNKKIIDILAKIYTGEQERRPGEIAPDQIISQIVMDTRRHEDSLEELRREIFPAFAAKGYPVPDI
jgi:two-component system OmpR family response regulator